MVGVVVVSHGQIGPEMVRIARSIVTEPASPMVGVALEHDEAPSKIREKIARAISSVDQNQGVLLLSDMFGGTPSNLCLTFLEEEKIEVITGVNLPMIIKLANYKENKPLSEVASFIKEYGQKNIALAGQVLKGGDERKKL